MEDQNLYAFVREQWISFSKVHYPSVMFGLLDKLNKLKFESKLGEVKKGWSEWGVGEDRFINLDPDFYCGWYFLLFWQERETPGFGN